MSERPKAVTARTPPVTATPPASRPAREAAPTTSPTTSPRGPVPGAGTRAGRIPVVDVQPQVEGGRFPAKAVVGEVFEVLATVFREGHDAVSANVVLRGPDGATAPFAPMRLIGPTVPDRWVAEVAATAVGHWTYAVEGWSDPVATWRHDAGIKVPAGLDTELMLEEGARVMERAAAGVPDGPRRRLLVAAAATLRDTARTDVERLAAGTGAEVDEALADSPLRDLVSSSAPLPLFVSRERALYGSWYELFPRSEGAHRGADGQWVSGTFAQAAERLPAVAAMGFDVVYLPPIHPIGRKNRKGANNTLTPAPDDPGSPWAIGAAEGGHDAVHPDLGTLEDFDAFVARAVELGMEVALDLALQAAPDHPWVTAHPEWFTVLADGTIAYAENPPKKYQDIYPVNFDRDPAGIYAEVLRIVRLWMAHGVRVFRVDNPHTKPVEFWEWLIGEVHRTDPDVLFLAEAFTRPPMMHMLGRVGFDQSYTYFTWRTGKAELQDYLTELSQETAAIVRPNFFTTTPDILHASLQYGGPPMFKVRAVLASTLSPTWGVYSGYELFEHVALRPGSEEFLDTEKFSYRPRDWAAYEPGGAREGQSLAPYLTRLNEVRRAHPALQRLRNLHFHESDSDQVLVYSKTEPLPDGTLDTVLVVVNLDPHAVREATVRLDLPVFGADWSDTVLVRDQITGAAYTWGEYAYVRLDPFTEPAHVLTVELTA